MALQRPAHSVWHTWLKQHCNCCKSSQALALQRWAPARELSRLKHKQAPCAACPPLCADDSDGEEGTADAEPQGAAQVPVSTSQPAGEAAGGSRGAAGLPAAEALPGSPRVSAAFGNAVDSAPAQHSTAAVAVAEPTAELPRAALPGRGRGRGDAGHTAAAVAAGGRKLKRGGSGTNPVPKATALGEWGCCHTGCHGARACQIWQQVAPRAVNVVSCGAQLRLVQVPSVHGGLESMA